MITLVEYAGPYWDHPDWTEDRRANARALLEKCASLENEMVADGVEFPINPHTKSGVSGETNGGFRPQDCPIGAPNSRHKQGKAVDRYDPHGAIDAWLMAHKDRLAAHGIAIEHPSATNGWSHWQDGAPGGDHWVFYP